MERSKEKKERRSSLPLPTPTAATNQGARIAANNIISNVLQQLAPRQEVADMDTSGSGTAEPKPDGAGTAGTAKASGSGTAGNTRGRSGTAGSAAAASGGISEQEQAATAPTQAPYRNFHQDNAPVAGSGSETIFTTARYRNIKTQRQLRGEHTALGNGPTADCFECGSIFVENDNRTSRAVLMEDTRELIVSTHSYLKEDWSCISCKRSHPLLPLTSRKQEWTGGRKLIFLTDHNMPAILPSKDDLCPIIMRIDGGLLREIGTAFVSQLSRYTVPEGSVIFIGSITHLMEEGRVGYAKGLVTEYIRLSKVFKNTVHVVPFLPPPMGGTNDPELVRSMMDIISWIEKVQKWDLNAYWGAYRACILSSGTGPEQVNQNTQRHKLPKSFDAYNDKVYMCHEWSSIRSGLAPLSRDSETVLVTALLENIATTFKWDLDIKPEFSRDSDSRCAVSSDPARPKADVILLGGSNCQRLHTTFAEMGVSVETISSAIWTINPTAVDICLNALNPLLARSDPSIPIVLWGLDNICYRAENTEGNLVRITRDNKDKKFHVVGDLVVAPFSLLQSAMQELKRLLAACGDRDVWIMEVLPRFLITHCCELATHCANVRLEGPAGTQACKKILSDLGELNALLAAHLTSPRIKMIATGDLLTGIKNATSGQLMDSMYNCWNLDPVHGEKVAYTRIGLGLLDLIQKEPAQVRGNSPCTRKRGRDDDSPAAGGRPRDADRSRSFDRSDRDRRAYQRDGSTASNRSGRSAYTVYPGDFDRRVGSPPGRRGGRGRYF
jgi:hypothetical protein